MKNSNLIFLVSLFGMGTLYAQEKRKIDISVDMLAPANDGSYVVGNPIPFRVVMTNNGPDNFLPQDTFLFVFNREDTYLAILEDSLRVGEEYYLYDSEVSTSGQTGEFELCVSVLWDNEMVSLDGSGTPLTSSWIDESPGNNEACAVIKVINPPTDIVDPGHTVDYLSLSPNPVRSNLTISLQQVVSDDYEWGIYAVDGSRLLRGVLQADELTNAVRVDVRGLAPGLYYLRLNSRQQSYSQSFLVQP